MKKSFAFALTCGCVFGSVLLSGCAPLLVGGAAATSATMITDRRSTGAIINDGVLEQRVNYEIVQKVPQSEQHVTVTSYDGKVLLTGEARTSAQKELIRKIAEASLDVASVIDEVTVAEPATLSERMSDSLLATRVRSALIATEGVSINQMKVNVDRGIVYLMGVVTDTEGRIAAKVASGVSGVKQVVKCFNIESDEQIQQRLHNLKTNK